MIQGYYRTSNLNTCLKRLMNQYGIIEPTGADYNDDTTTEQSKQNFNSHWPKSMGQAFSTLLERDEEDGDYVFNIELTQEEVDSMPKNDNPNFTFQYAGEREDPQDPESPLLPLPTFKKKVYGDGVWTGAYYDRTVTIMQ